VTRFLAANLDAVDLLAALVQSASELLEEPGAEGDGEPKATTGALTR